MLTHTPNLRTIQLLAKNQKLAHRLEIFKKMIPTRQTTYLRSVVSAADRVVTVEDRVTGKMRTMLMFASNNYLGLANHPHVQERVKQAINQYGTGIGGPPLLNGYIKLIEETEQCLAVLKRQESAMIFSSGFLANLGLVSALAQHNDVILYDELCHASLYEGIRLCKAKSVVFGHNDLDGLETLLQRSVDTSGSVFVCIEGVYSMDGDLSPLPDICFLCKKYQATLIIDDAHGTGVLGEKGSGTAAMFGCSEDVDITMGTFSKVFASCGGFIAGSEDMINYLRFHARSYIFSASIPPPVAATVLGGLEVMENEPWHRAQLLENVAYAVKKLEPFEFWAQPQAAILALKLPERMNIRKASLLFHERDIFINPIEYPAVAASKQRFRISIMSTHSREDINQLATAVEEVYNNPKAFD